MKKQNFKFLSLVMCTTLTLQNAMPIFASEPNLNNEKSNNSIESVTYQNTEDEDYINATNVFAELVSEYKVTIPKYLVLSGTTKDARYYVKVSGDIAGYEIINVVPDSEFILNSKNKDGQKALVSQDKTQWRYSDFSTNALGNIKADGITAGKWQGTFNFNLDLEKTQDYDEKLGHQHNWVLTESIKPTCIEKGSNSYYCPDCKETKIEEVEKLPHTFTNYISNNDATCTKDGTKTAVCDVCGDAYDIITDENTKLNHPYTKEVVEPTCIAQGYTKYTCDVCGDSVDNVIPALGHNFVNGTCSRCGKFDISQLDAGLYDENYNITKSWDELLDEGTVHVDDKGNFTTNIVYLDNGEATDKNDSSDAINGTLILPNTITTLKANSLGYLTKLKAVYIPETVTSIEDDTFNGNESLESINIDEDNKYFTIEDDILFNKNKTALISCPPSHEGEVYEIPSIVKTIYSGAFSNTNIDYILVPSDITSIGSDSFRNSKIKSMDLSACTNIKRLGLINENSRYIYYGTFDGCTELTSIKLPESLEIIGDRTFYNCTSLNNLNVPKTVKEIGTLAFNNVNSVYYYGDAKYRTDSSNYLCWGAIMLNDDIGKYSSEMLTSTALQEIGYTVDKTDYFNIKVLKDGNEVTEIVIPDYYLVNGKYKKIAGKYDFTDFSSYKNLESISVSEKNTLLSSVDGVLFNKDKTELILYPADKKDTSYTIPDTVTSIDNYAFSGCTSLTQITIPASITKINSTVFNGCTSLSSINVDSENKYYVSENGVLFNKDKTELILYPAGKKDTSYTIPDTVTSINDYTFYNIKSLKEITIPTSVTNIGNNAFYGSGLTKVSIPDSVTNIGNSAFSSCSNLANVKLSNSINIIKNSTFSSCSSLKQITIPDSVETIGDYAFQFSGLTSINLNKVKTIGDGAFGWNSLTQITIPNSVTSIGKNTFSYLLTSIKSATFEDTNGWYVTQTKNATSGTNVDVTNASTNATNLNFTYLNYYWYKK